MCFYHKWEIRQRELNFGNQIDRPIVSQTSRLTPSVFQLTEGRLESPTTMTLISLRSSLSRKQKQELYSSIVTRYLLLLGGLYKQKITTFSSLTLMSELQAQPLVCHSDSKHQLGKK